MHAPAGIDWAWAQRTGGMLSTRQRLQLLAALARVAPAFTRSRIRLATGRRGTARLDDQELGYVSCLLHDTHLEHPTPGRCFAVVGGEHAEQFALDRGTEPDRAAQIGAAIAGHITIGAADDLSDPAGFVSAGAIADITGVGLEHADPTWVNAVHQRHPRHQLHRHLITAGLAEQQAVPHGRMRWNIRYSGLPLFVLTAPFND